MAPSLLTKAHILKLVSRFEFANSLSLQTVWVCNYVSKQSEDGYKYKIVNPSENG